MATTTKPPQKFSSKDHLFNRDRVQYLANLFVATDDRFDAKRFLRDTTSKFPKLELKERIGHIASVLENHLDHDFGVAAKQITMALPPPLDPSKSDDDFGDFIFAPLGEFVVRLVSEGTRPRLPWSVRLTTSIHRPLELLNVLHADPMRYVTRSVANHLHALSRQALHYFANQWTTLFECSVYFDSLRVNQCLNVTRNGMPEKCGIMIEVSKKSTRLNSAENNEN